MKPCTDCGKNPRRAPDQRWCTGCHARRKRERAVEREVHKRIQIINAGVYLRLGVRQLRKKMFHVETSDKQEKGQGGKAA